MLQNSNMIDVFFNSTAQQMKFSIKDFLSKCDQIRRKLRIWLHLLKKSLMENFIFCAVIGARAQNFTSNTLFVVHFLHWCM